VNTLFALVTDPYERKARLYPALLLIAPPLAAGAAVAPSALSGLRSLATTAVAFGGLFLLAQLSRDAGRRKERGLFASWGGKPSVAIFRHSDSRLSATTKARYHKKLVSLVKGTKAPSPADEEANPAQADDTYAAWSDFLRVNARENSKKYPLVFHENVSYGYRRNVWGMRPLGIASSGVAVALCVGLAVARWRSHMEVGEPLIGASALGLIALLLWVFSFTRDWVRVPADAYAERLAEAVESLGASASAPRQARGKPKEKP
jgi:hypothetical protein